MKCAGKVVEDPTQTPAWIGIILRADFRSTFTILAPLLNLLRRATASSMVEWWMENSSLAMKSLMLRPSGADK